MGVFAKAKMQGELGSDADLDSVADFFESALGGILSDHLKSGPKPAKADALFGISQPLREGRTWNRIAEPLPSRHTSRL
jgi:hypothetical protein